MTGGGVKIEGEDVEQDEYERCSLRIHVTGSSPISSKRASCCLDALESRDSPACGRGRVREQPRREGQAALFLEKTYELLAQCPPELASWTAQGDTFVVKQPAEFAARVIPTYFKHRKFTSFVRQLNLYGFKKVRTVATGPGRLDAEMDTGRARGDAQALEHSSEWWEFRHDHFVRGRRELLGEIQRRCSPCGARAALTPRTALGATAATATTTTRVDRVEFEDLKAEVGGLRDEMRKLQWTNQQLAGLLQTLLQRCSCAEQEVRTSGSQHEYAEQQTAAGYANSPSVAAQAPRVSLPSITIPSSNVSASVVGPQLALLQLRQGHPAQSTPKHDGGQTPRTPLSGPFQLRPVQTLMVNRSPSSRQASSSRLTRSYGSTPSYSEEQKERNHQRWYRPTSLGQPSPSTCRSPLKRIRVDSATSVSEAPTGYGVYSPEDMAVRQLSRIASEIRSDLLACITARITGFLRVHCDQTESRRDAEVDTVGEAVGSDIRLKLGELQTTSTADPMLLDVETTCMYRVEILKFISRELPRAVQEAIDKRMPAPEKLKQRSAKDRSQLAQLVQKAQKALEQQMHAETSVSSTGRRSMREGN